jgi:hypothetical protein
MRNFPIADFVGVYLVYLAWQQIPKNLKTFFYLEFGEQELDYPQIVSPNCLLAVLGPCVVGLKNGGNCNIIIP